MMDQVSNYIPGMWKSNSVCYLRGIIFNYSCADVVIPIPGGMLQIAVLREGKHAFFLTAGYPSLNLL